MISISNVGSFIFEDNCLILQLKLSLNGMTTTGDPSMVWSLRDIPAWYDHYGISMHGMITTGYPCMVWPQRNIPAWYDHYGISLHGMTTTGYPCMVWPLLDIEGMHKMEISAQCLILRFTTQFSTSGRFIHRYPCLGSPCIILTSWPGDKQYQDH